MNIKGAIKPKRLLALAIILALFAACAPAGGIVVTESVSGTGCNMEFKKFSETQKCELALEAGDALEVEISRESGEISLSITGKNGSRVYTGNGLKSRSFTVTVSETDQYIVEVSGKRATGEIRVEKI